MIAALGVVFFSSCWWPPQTTTSAVRAPLHGRLQGVAAAAAAVASDSEKHGDLLRRMREYARNVSVADFDDLLVDVLADGAETSVPLTAKAAAAVAKKTAPSRDFALFTVLAYPPRNSTTITAAFPKPFFDITKCLICTLYAFHPEMKPLYVLSQNLPAAEVRELEALGAAVVPLDGWRTDLMIRAYNFKNTLQPNVQPRKDGSISTLRFAVFNTTIARRGFYIDADFGLSRRSQMLSDGYNGVLPCALDPNCYFSSRVEVMGRGYHGYNAGIFYFEHNDALFRALIARTLFGQFVRYTNGDQDILESLFPTCDGQGVDAPKIGCHMLPTGRQTNELEHRPQVKHKKFRYAIEGGVCQDFCSFGVE